MSKTRLDDEKLEAKLNEYEAKVSEDSISDAEIRAERFRNNSKIRPLWDRIQMMFEIVRHPELWGKSKVVLWVGAALIYLVTPIDLIPDIIPVIGLSDDAAAILFTINRVSSTVRTVLQAHPEYLDVFPERLRSVVRKCFKLD